MKRLRCLMRGSALLASAWTAAASSPAAPVELSSASVTPSRPFSVPISVSDVTTSSMGLQDLVQEILAEEAQHDVMNELADQQAQVRIVAATEAAEKPIAQPRFASGLRGARTQATAGVDTATGGDDAGLTASSQDTFTLVENENEQLHKVLEQASGYERRLEGQLKQIPSMQRRLASELKRERALEMQLENSTHSISHYKHDLESARFRLGASQRKNSELSQVIRNMTAEKRELQNELLNSSRIRHDDEVTLAAAIERLNNSGGTRDDFEKLRKSLRQATERSAAEERRLKSDGAAAKNAFRRIAQLQQKLNATERRLSDEITHEGKLNETAKSLARQLRSDRDAVAKRLTTANHRLAKEVGVLKRRVAEGDRARKHAQDVAAEAQHSLARAVAETQQLKGSMPWLEDKVAADQRDLKKATDETKAAYEARDVATAMLDEAKQKIVHLEQQYASVVQSLAHEGGSSAVEDGAINSERDSTMGDRATALDGPAAAPVPNLTDVAAWSTTEADAELDSNSDADADAVGSA